jgi:pSer/pThr/pTyr-binding forkhead associated (FHA) protein
MLRLIVTHGREEQVFAVPLGEAKLGSASENDIVLRIPGVSRRHALVRRCPGGVELIDKGSKNGILVAGARVARTVLTPGLRLQVGAAWLEVQEGSSIGEAVLRLLRDSSEEASGPPSMTAVVRPGKDPQSRTPSDAALALAYYIAQAGVGKPEKREDLLHRIKAVLGARAFATFERTRRGRLRIMESAGELSPMETTILASLAKDVRNTALNQIALKRGEHLLLAGRESWFLAASFAEEHLAREGWRKEFLQFLVAQFFMPVRSLDDTALSEVLRVFALARGNKRRMAELLDVSPGKLYLLLERLGLYKRRSRR